MKTFKDLNIQTEQRLQGKKISIEDIVDREIIVCDFQIEPSKFQKKGDETCLWLQIELDSSKRVVFTGSKSLQGVLRKVNKEEQLPFKTTITFKDKRYDFT